MIQTGLKKKRMFLALICLVCSGCNLSGNSATPILASATPSTVQTNVPTATSTPQSSTMGESPATEASPQFVPLKQSAPDCNYGGEFKTIEALDRNTIRFILCQSDVAFLAKIAFPPFGILPAKFLAKTGGGGKGNELLLHPLGSGPYQVVDWHSGESIKFTAFSGYWDKGQSQSANLVFRWNLDEGQRLLEIQSGTAQGVDDVSSQDLSSLVSDPNILVMQRDPLSILYLGMNNTYPPFDDRQVRLAISMAIDRQKLIDDDFLPGFKLANFFTPCAISNGCVGEAWYGYNPEMAKDLITKAGYPDGFETQLSYRNLVRGYLPYPSQLVKEIQAQLKSNLNITLKLVPIDSDEFLRAADDGLLPGLFLLGWGADYPDVSDFLDTHFGDRATQLFGSKFGDILLTLRLGAGVASDEQRRPYYEQANNAIREHVLMIPLAYGGWINPDDMTVAYRKIVKGAYASPFGLERFADFLMSGGDSLVWVQSNEPLSLYCADETDIDSLRACSQVIEPLYRFASGKVQVEPALAERCEPNPELTVWTCSLRNNVKFQDGSILDANDVVTSFLVQWDATNPLHKGRTGEFAYFKSFWGEFLNVKNHK
jgi:peptide/nickel transport system substrate-binding protein